MTPERMKKLMADMEKINRQRHFDMAPAVLPPGPQSPRARWPWEPGPITTDYLPVSNRSTS